VIDGRHRGLFVGILITLMGVIFLLDQLRIVHAGYIFAVFWPVILIVFGLSILARTSTPPINPGDGAEWQTYRRHSGHFWGPVLIVIGGLWLLSNLTGFAAERLWPLWMIAVGVWLLVNRDHYDEIRSGRRQRREMRDWWKHHGRYADGTPPPTVPPPAAPGAAPGSPGTGGGPGPGAASPGFSGPGTGGHEYWANEHGQYGVGPQPPPNVPPPTPGSPEGSPGAGGRPGPSASFVGGPGYVGPGYAGPGGYPPPSESIDDTFDRSVIFMSFNRRITSKHFRFGKVSAIFGGFHLDFTGADIEGNQAVLQIEAVFGGGEIRVPPGWRVSITAHEIAGAFSDETYSHPGAAAPAKVLLIHGTAVFGGVVIKN
jgi:LiaF transmembrane domain